ncbi:MAG: hypothetical protein ACUVWK_00590 [Nitrososphaerales archaeon]
MDEQDLTQIEQKISSLTMYRVSLIDELRKLSQKKRELRGEIKENVNRVKEKRSAVLEQNELINQLEDARKDTLSKINGIKERVREVEKVLREFEREAPRESEKSLTERLKKIEWKLQTEPLTRDEEKQLVEYIKDLEFKLHLWKRAYTTRQELSAFLSEVKSLRDKLDEASKMKRLALLHLKDDKEMLRNIAMARAQLWREDEEIGQDMAELKENLKSVDADLFRLRESKRSMLERKRMEEMASMKVKEQVLIEEAKSKAEDKLKKGKSLSWDELKVLFGEDLSK